MAEIIVPSYVKRSGVEKWDEMNGRDPLDERKVKFLDGSLIPAEIFQDISRAAAKCGMDVDRYVVERAGMAALYDLTGADYD